MTAFYNQRLAIYKALLDIKIASFPDMSTHFYIGLDDVFLSKKRVSSKAK